jgi:GH15 family glucan-1,4-alpha-glucosidase
MRDAILCTLWDEDEHCFLRGIKVEMNASEFTYMMGDKDKKALPLDYSKREKVIVAKDSIVDSSLLGLVYPFEFLAATDRRMCETAQKIEARLTSPKIGGIKRCENDRYFGGNPWIICTLWLALYYIDYGDNTKAEGLLKWVLAHQTKMGLLAEQIDKETGKPAWIIPLTWSHAMFILTVRRLYEK